MIYTYIFEKEENLNAELQKESLNFHTAHRKINTIVSLFADLREYGFEEIWAEAENKARRSHIPRPRKIPSRISHSSNGNEDRLLYTIHQ